MKSPKENPKANEVHQNLWKQSIIPWNEILSAFVKFHQLLYNLVIFNSFNEWPQRFLIFAQVFFYSKTFDNSKETEKTQNYLRTSYDHSKHREPYHKSDKDFYVLPVVVNAPPTIKMIAEISKDIVWISPYIV